MFDLGGYSPLILRGLAMTVTVSVIAMFIATILGTALAISRSSGNRVLAPLSWLYTTTIRGIPELILILLIYYGVPTLVQDFLAARGQEVVINFNPFVAGCLTLGCIYAAFVSEVLRGAYDAYDKRLTEAGSALGLRSFKIFFLVIAPIVFRRALPGLSNVWLVLVKATSLISVIQLQELLRASDIAARATREPFTLFAFASLLYLSINFVSTVGQGMIDRRVFKWIDK